MLLRNHDLHDIISEQEIVIEMKGREPRIKSGRISD